MMNLWPFSRITAGVLVLNVAKRGDLGDTIEFTTPEGGQCYFLDDSADKLLEKLKIISCLWSHNKT